MLQGFFGLLTMGEILMPWGADRQKNELPKEKLGQIQQILQSEYQSKLKNRQGGQVQSKPKIINKNEKVEKQPSQNRISDAKYMLTTKNVYDEAGS